MWYQELIADYHIHSCRENCQLQGEPQQHPQYLPKQLPLQQMVDFQGHSKEMAFNLQRLQY